MDDEKEIDDYRNECADLLQSHQAKFDNASIYISAGAIVILFAFTGSGIISFDKKNIILLIFSLTFHALSLLVTVLSYLLCIRRMKTDIAFIDERKSDKEKIIEVNVHKMSLDRYKEGVRENYLSFCLFMIGIIFSISFLIRSLMVSITDNMINVAI